MISRHCAFDTLTRRPTADTPPKNRSTNGLLTIATGAAPRTKSFDVNDLPAIGVPPMLSRKPSLTSVAGADPVTVCDWPVIPQGETDFRERDPPAHPRTLRAFPINGSLVLVLGEDCCCY
jgi:hypothetical protein